MRAANTSATSHWLSGVLVTVLLHALIFGQVTKAAEHDEFPTMTAMAEVLNGRPEVHMHQKRQGGPLSPVISGIDGLTTLFPFGTGATTPAITPTSTPSSSSSSSSQSSSSLSSLITSSSSAPSSPSSSTTSSSTVESTTSSVRVVTHTSALVSSYTQQYTTVFTTVDGTNTIAQTQTSVEVVASTTGFATSVSTPSLTSEGSTGSSSGLSSSSKAVVGGVVGGVGGALLLAGIGFVLWRLYGRNRNVPEGEGLMSDRHYPYMSQQQSTGHSTSPAGLDRSGGNANVNPAANF